MQGKFKVITLCGSTKFKKEFIEAAERLSLEGNIVISVGLFGHADNKFETVITDEIKEMLDEAHREKIAMSDAIYVINPGGYIGSSTRREILYARALKKEIMFLETPTFKYKGAFESYAGLNRHIENGLTEPMSGDIYMICESGGFDIYDTPITAMSMMAYDPSNGGFYVINPDDMTITLKDPYPYLGDSCEIGKVVSETIEKCEEILNSSDDDKYTQNTGNQLRDIYLCGEFDTFKDLQTSFSKALLKPEAGDAYCIRMGGGKDSYDIPIKSGDIVVYIINGWKKLETIDTNYIFKTREEFESFHDLLMKFNICDSITGKPTNVNIGDTYTIKTAGGKDYFGIPILAGDTVMLIKDDSGMYGWARCSNTKTSS